MSAVHGTTGAETSSNDTDGASGPRKPTGVYRRGDTVWRITESVASV